MRSDFVQETAVQYRSQEGEVINGPKRKPCRNTFKKDPQLIHCQHSIPPRMSCFKLLLDTRNRGSGLLAQIKPRAK
eukprot:scaffold94771_cov14-Tisochrysis_lutea.AAC.2